LTWSCPCTNTSHKLMVLRRCVDNVRSSGPPPTHPFRDLHNVKEHQLKTGTLYRSKKAPQLKALEARPCGRRGFYRVTYPASSPVFKFKKPSLFKDLNRRTRC